jgi:serine/threonine-protein kinase RsbW
MKFLGYVRDFILGFIRKNSLPAELENKVILAIDEAVANVIEHAYEEKNIGYIDILADIDERKLSFTICDNGKSFKPKLMKKLDIQEFIKSGKKGGLGIFLMRQVMDEVKYTFKNGQNQVCLIKYIK